MLVHMSDQWAPVAPPRPPRRWPRRLAWAAGVLFVLVVILYFVVTSHAFLEAFVLPKAGAALGTPVAVRDSSISPFRKIVLRDVKLGGNAFEEPVVALREVRLRYSLIDILRGHINIHEVSILSPVVQIVQQEDGTSNLDPFLKPSGEPPPPEAPSKPVHLHLGRLILSNALVRFTKNLAGGGREIAELSNVNLTAADLGNAKAGTLNFRTGIRFERTPGQNATNGTAELIEAKLAGGFEIALTADLKPDVFRGTTSLDVITPPAAARDIKGTSALLECDLTPAELRQLALTFKQGEKTLGQITATGPLDLQRKEAQINLQITAIDRHALNTFGAAAGLDFGSTTINSSQQIVITNAGQLIIASGRFAADKFGVVRAGAATRPLNLGLDFNLTLDQGRKLALIDRFTISGEQDGTKVIQGALAGPMRLELGGGTNLLDQSAFDLQITNLNLSDWRAFIGDVSGVVNLGLRVTATNAGQHLATELDSRVGGLTASFGSNKIDRATVALSLRGALDGMKTFHLDDVILRMGREAQTAATVILSASGDIKTHEAIASLSLDTDGASLTNLVPLAGIPLGALKLNAQLQQRGQKLDLNSLAAQFAQAGRAPNTLTVRASYDLAATNGSAVAQLKVPDAFALAPTNPIPGQPLSLDILMDAGLASGLGTLRELTVKLAQSGKPGGSFAATGQFNLADQSGALRLKITDLNESMLSPFLTPALGNGRTLKSCAIGLTLDAQYNPNGASSVKSELLLERLLITDPVQQFPTSPLNTTVRLSGSMQKDEVLIETFSADLGMANTPGGQIRASGKYHLKSKAAEGSLKVLDLNEKLLAPFAAALLGERRLASVSINMDVAGRYDPARDISAKADLNIANLLVSDRQGNFPKTPLAVGLQLNSAMATNKMFNIETFRLKLAPTARANNELNITGKLDLSRTNSFGGDLQLAAEALDLTPYYDLLASPPATNAAPAAPAKPASAPARPVAVASKAPEEPPPVNLPLQNFNLAINIGQLYLRELAIHNWQTTTKIDSNHVRVAPLQLLVNGAPCKGTVALNLGVPGFQYDLALNADNVPIGPIADTFAPEQKGKIKGNFVLASQIKGAGVTGRSLQTSLAGQAAMTVTNANFQLTAPWIRTLFYPIGLAVGAPDLVNSPVSWLAATATMGSGKIDFTQFNLVSETFTADTQGKIKIADIITDSPIEKWPMHLFLRRSLALRVGKIPRTTPPDAEYVKMPDFVNIVGTVGSPKPEINKLALAGTISEKLLDKALGDKVPSLNPLNLLGK
jgi:hypothetical protein